MSLSRVAKVCGRRHFIITSKQKDTGVYFQTISQTAPIGPTLMKLHAKGSFFMHRVVSKYSLKMLSYPFSSVKERQKTREHQKIQWSDNEDRLIWSTKHAKYDYNCTVIYPWGFSNQKLKLRLINSPIIRSLSLFAIYKYISQKLCIYRTGASGQREVKILLNTKKRGRFGWGIFASRKNEYLSHMS